MTTAPKLALFLLFLLATAEAAAATTPFFPQSVASGDPRTTSVVLWTRVEDAAADPLGANDLPLSLEVALTPDLASVVQLRTDLLARAVHDHCVKVKVAGLQPNTTYYYRFVYQAKHASPVGRTRTAPDPAQEVPVRFAFLSCQDYIGRYYNTLADLAHREPDTLNFIVHLGDYIYETTGNPAFQQTNGVRAIRFDDAAGALALSDSPGANLAARSLSNYRQLYRTYRSDPALQRVHELYPFLNVWDDHEYSDDCWGATATYFEGTRNELDPERRRDAERAFFEYLPIDIGLDDHGIALNESMLYPNARIYRDFAFGSLLHLILTDCRSFRPDHLIPEDAFPGTMVLEEPALANLLSFFWRSARSSFDPYVDLAAPTNAALQSQVRLRVAQAYVQAGRSESESQQRATQAAAGKISTKYLDALFAEAGLSSPVDPNTVASLPRGLSYRLLGKLDLFSSIGSRYVVPRATFGLYAAYVATNEPARGSMLGATQEAYVRTTLATSRAQWNIVANSVSMCPLGFDFANPPLPLPANFPDIARLNLQLNTDDWGGFPGSRQTLLDLLADANGLIVSGDLHSSFITAHRATDGRVVPEFTGTSVTSTTVREGARKRIAGTSTFAGVPGIDALLAAMDVFLEDSVNKTGARLVGSRTDANGYVVVQLDREGVTAEYRHLPSDQVSLDRTSPESAAVLASLFDTTTYRVTRDTGGLSLRAQPALTAAVDLDAGQVVLKWKPAGAGCLVQREGELSVPSRWEPVVAEPRVQQGEATVILPLDAASRFFRLQCP